MIMNIRSGDDASFSCQQQVIAVMAVPGTNTVLLELALRELALRELRWQHRWFLCALLCALEQCFCVRQKKIAGGCKK